MKTKYTKGKTVDYKQALYNHYFIDEKWRDYLQRKITHEEFIKYARALKK